MDRYQQHLYCLDKIRNRDKCWTNRYTMFYLYCFRSCCSKKRNPLIFLAKLCVKFFKISGVEINTKSLGGGVRLPHLNGIYIHRNVICGENCTIFQQVTIGVNEHKYDFEKAPQIGNRVYIGAGAKIIGNITIGDDVRVGANAVVTKNVPKGMTVVGYNRMLNIKSERNGVI